MSEGIMLSLIHISSFDQECAYAAGSLDSVVLHDLLESALQGGAPLFQGLY